ncbi:MAG: N-acetyltransferase family protein [Vicinamibacterales bacterium]
MPAATIRSATPADGPSLNAIYAPYCTGSTVSFETGEPGGEEMARRVRAVQERGPWIVCEVSGAVAGYAYASRHRDRAAYRWAVDTAVYVAPPFHRRGIGRALYTTLFALLRAQGYVRACAGITVPNEGSVRLHESCGFTPVGIYRRVGYKLGAWRDVAWYQADLQPDPAVPAEPLPLAAVSDEVWRRAVAEGVSQARVDGERTAGLEAGPGGAGR